MSSPDVWNVAPAEGIEIQKRLRSLVRRSWDGRAIGLVAGAWRGLSRTPDCILCDGHGVAHPRGLGLASHLGLVLGIPTIGSVLRTRDRTKPLYVSVGHLVNLKKAVSIVLSCTGRFRISEPLRAAHRLADTGRT